MASESRNVLAGVGSGSGSGLAFFAPAGTAGPADASVALAPAYLDAGWITEDGLTAAVDEENTEIPAFGTFSPVRILTTSSTRTFSLAFLETNEVSLAVYHRQELADVAFAADGTFTIQEGGAASVQYAVVFELVDGDNRVRAFLPNAEVTDREDFTVSGGEAVSYGVTLTAYPDNTGTSVYWHYLVDSLNTV